MAGTITVVHYQRGPFTGRLVCTLTGDASTGSFPATALPAFEGQLAMLVTNPGAPAPTDNWDVSLIDDNGLDRLQGLGTDRDTVNSEAVNIVHSGTSLHPPVARGETLTLTPTGNSVASAVIVLTLFYTR